MDRSLPDLYLASKSPRRRELLDQIGVRYAWAEGTVDESRPEGEAAEVYVLRLALAKARAGFAYIADRDEPEPLPVLGADTIVVVDDDILGKPVDRQDGLAMLARLSGREHRVLTAVALVDGEREATRLSVSGVTFRALSDAERAGYWDTGEPFDKAGGYAVQGKAAAFIQALSGSYSGVMGLPLFETAQLLEEFGIDYRSNW